MALTKVDYSMIKNAPQVSVTNYGAIGDGVTDDTAAIQAAIDTGLSIVFPTATYRVFSNLTFANDNQFIDINGSTLIFRNPATRATAAPSQLIVTGSNVLFEMNNGTFSQEAGYAEVAVNTTPGGSTITVVDSSTLYSGQTLVSSWGEMAVEPGVYPIGGPIAALNARRTISISGNTVTLSAPMNGSAAYLPAGLVVGEWSFGVFLAVSGGGTVTFQNGKFERMPGYYYHTPSTANGETIIFNNMNFASNGTDQFLIYNNQKMYFNSCKVAQQYDPAKSGIWFDGSASVYIDSCDMALGYYDSSINLAGTRASFTGGEIFISNSRIGGTSALGVTAGEPQTQNGLQFIEHRGSGTFNRIFVSNSRIYDYTRFFYSGTTNNVTNNIVLASMQIDNCSIDGSFAYFIMDGSGKNLNVSQSRISNTAFYQSEDYQFFYIDNVNGAVTNFMPEFDNCYFKLNNALAQFYSPAIIRNSTFNSTPLKHNKGVAEIQNCLFENNSTITISPSYSEEFYGEIEKITINDADYPTNPSAIFTALGGSSLSGAKLASARSINGSTYYNVFKLGTNIYVSGTFYIANGIYKLRGDDWYIPIGSHIEDMYTGDSYKVTFNLATTLASTAAAGATSIVVGSATGVAVGDKVNIYCDNQLVDTRVVDAAYAGGTTIPLTAATTYAAASGNSINFFRVV